MQSELPKVLVPVCGKPMIRYVLDGLRAAGVEQIVVVVGYRSDLVREELEGEPGVSFVEQTEQLGTGHAVMVCREKLEKHRGQSGGPVVIVTGDSPMLQSSSIQALLADWNAADKKNAPYACLIGTAHREDPTDLGRVVRDGSGKFEAIVEERDASEAQRAITEVNMSTYLFDAENLLTSLESLTTANAQSEYYITDCPGILLSQGRRVDALAALRPCEALSINNLQDLAAVETEMLRMSGTAQQT